MNSGLDPELLALAGDHIVPAAKFLPGPQIMGKGFMNHVSFDNAAAEFRPAHTSRRSRLVARLRNLLWSAVRAMGDAEHRLLIPTNTRFTLAPAAVLKPMHRRLKSVSTFGCSPSQILENDYGVRTSVPIVSANETRVRSAGFHVHQELPYSTVQHCVGVLDGLLGLQDVIMNHHLGFIDESRLRRIGLGYGRAGEFRTRNALSGRIILEYRTLSPWPFLSPSHVMRVVGLSAAVCRQTPDFLLSVLEDFPTRASITRAINRNEYGSAAKLYAKCMKAWNTHYEETYGTAQEASTKGIETHDVARRRDSVSAKTPESLLGDAAVGGVGVCASPVRIAGATAFLHNWRS